MQAEPTPSLRIPDCLPASRAVASLLPAAGRQVFNAVFAASQPRLASPSWLN